ACQQLLRTIPLPFPRLAPPTVPTLHELSSSFFSTLDPQSRVPSALKPWSDKTKKEKPKPVFPPPCNPLTDRPPWFPRSLVALNSTPESLPTPAKTPRSRKAVSRSTSSAAAATSWSHTPTPLTLLWLGVSLPLVVWDTGYVLGRPLTMEGGSLHWPLWTPYKLYGEIDHIYGWKAFNAGNGFTSAQGTLNVVETIMYLAYLYLWRNNKAADGSVRGREGGLALLLGWAAAVMTLSKTVLYWLNEYYAGFDNIGHNSLINLIFLWIIPNGAWLVGPTYMIYVMGADILDAFTLASRGKSD
ncbi:hypothetical protein jhhlp_002116, partial [Lomentospora prolificans]